jgi:hypothetical protein
MKPLSFLLYRSVADPRRRQEEAITLCDASVLSERDLSA